MIRTRIVPPSFAALSALAAPAVAATQPAAAVPASGNGSYVFELLAILVPLAFIIVCLLVLLRIVRRRFGLTGNDAPLTVVQVLPVGPRERIVVVRSRAGRAFAVGVGAQAVTLIAPLDEDDLRAPAATVDRTLPADPGPAESITTRQG